MMDIVDRYLRTVKRYLPAAGRDDIVAELAANIREEIDVREASLGRALESSDYHAILDAYGHPVDVAARFGGGRRSFTFGRQIVGPGLFPFYVRVAAVNVLAAAAIATLAATVYHIPTWTGAPNVLAHIVFQLAIVTLIFASLQWSIDTYPQRWDVEPRGARPHVSRFESISALVAIVVVNVWLLPFVRGSDAFAMKLGGTLILTPVWHRLAFPYLVLVFLELVRNGVNFVRPDWLRFRSWMLVAANGVCLFATIELIQATARVAPATPGEALHVQFARTVDQVIVLSLFVTAAICVASIAWNGWRLARTSKAGRTLGAVAFLSAAVLFSGTPQAFAETPMANGAATAAGRCALGTRSFEPGRHARLVRAFRIDIPDEGARDAN